MMLVSRPTIFSTLALLLSAISAQPVWSMGQEAFGPAGPHIGRSADWPRGVEDILRHESRVYWNWVNGNEHAFYDGDITNINELLDLFAKIDLSVHRVIVRAGRPSTRSFQDLVVHYNVEFELPGGIYLHHVRGMAATGLYATIPRLIIHLDDKLVRHLDELHVPENVTLQDAPYRVEDALAQANSADNSLRWRAVSLLGQIGESSPEVASALKQAAGDENANLQAAAKKSMEQIEQANDPETRPLRQQIAGFLLNHPQRLRTPGPDELLDAMRSVDERYARGFTARGTMILNTLSGRCQLVAWTVTMGDQKLVIQQKAVVDELHPPTEDLVETTYYISPDQMGTIHRSRLWVDGKLIDTKPHATFEPVGSTYDILIGRILWPLGRGFTRRIDHIEEVTRIGDGTLRVKAESNVGNLPWRWELSIDPDSDYLVRSAKTYLRDSEEPSYIIDSLGTQQADGRSTAHTARWREGTLAEPISMAVHSVSADMDTGLIKAVEEQLAQLKAESR